MRIPALNNEVVSEAISVLYHNTVKYRGFNITVPHLERYPIPYCWDTAFHVLAFLHFDVTLAKENLECLLSLADPDGKIPNAPTEAGDQDLRSQPPIIVYSALRLYEVERNRELLLKWYPSLKQYYWWWRKKGDPLNHGFISPFTGAREKAHPKTAYWAVCSTGMDNHPIYDFTNGNALEVNGLYYIPVKDLLLTSTLALAAKALAEMAGQLKFENDKAVFEQEYECLSEKYRYELWDDVEEFYFAADWKGSRIKVKSVQAFVSLLADIPDSSQRKHLIGHLTSPEEFWGNLGIPSVAFDDETYMTPQPSWYYSRDPYYWRGPIWAPTTYLVFRALLNNGYANLAREVVQRWVDLVYASKEFPEYFYADGRPGATRLSNFGWTAAVTVSMLVESGLVSRSEVTAAKEQVEELLRRRGASYGRAD
ncbi:MAG: trehalase family glycosidase [Thermofilum sp.]